jgi:hypothetical protein
MPKPRKDQKTIAQRYAGNLRYFNRLHPLRRTRLFLVVICTLAGMAAAAIYLLYWHTVPTATGGSSISANEKPDDRSQMHKDEWFNSAGGISQAHSRYAQDCEKCHDPSVNANVAQPAVIKASLDAKCQVCHNNPPYNFHQVNVVTGAAPSCTDCHHEHLGTGPMQPVTDANCLTCHGNATIMAQSAQLGNDLHATMQPFRLDSNLVYFKPANASLRPPGGYTNVFQSFSDGHPDFQIQRENLSDPDTLKFGHKFHLSAQVRNPDGSPLTCEQCHKPDSTGAYMQPITFAKNCQECHTIQIDPTLKDFVVPHPTGESGASSARNFLLTLPAQFASYATQVESKTTAADVTAFVGKHMKMIQQRVRNGENLENEVFLSDGKHIYYNGTSAPPSEEKPLFAGCAECHDVTPSEIGEPKITLPVIPDRWYVHAKFNHAVHAAIRTCEECHTQARTSEKTSDILLPDRASCLECHSPAPKGGVVSTCTTCHDYHNEAPGSATADMTPLRRMMMGNAPLVQVSGQR